jgi:hypothetical protein
MKGPSSEFDGRLEEKGEVRPGENGRRAEKQPAGTEPDASVTIHCRELRVLTHSPEPGSRLLRERMRKENRGQK